MKYRTYLPQKLPFEFLDWDPLIGYIGRAHATLARYDEIVCLVHHPRHVFSLLTLREALASSASQKLCITLEDLLVCLASGSSFSDPQLRGVEKVLNYKEALERAVATLQRRPLSLKLLCEMHRTIQLDLPVVREKGRFRDRQNWVGPEGCSFEKAFFYPPNVETMKHGLRNLKSYLAHKEKDLLVQLALFFGQFLMIHPFMDGNGRVARAFLPLFLYKKKLVHLPLFYLSPYFKRHRIKYLDILCKMTTDGHWEQWVVFFLQAIIEEGVKSIELARKMVGLYHSFKELVGNSPDATAFINQLFSQPIFDRQMVKEREKLRILDRLEKLGVIVDYCQKPFLVVKDLLALIKS